MPKTGRKYKCPELWRRGSNPFISANGSYICTKSCVIQVLVRKRKTNYGDSYHKELEETDRILLARRPKIWGRVIRGGRGISKRIGGWMLTGKWVRFPYTPQKTFFETI